MSGGPNGAAMAVASVSSAARSATSPATAATAPPASSQSASSASRRRATPTTRAPARASTSAACRPRPALAPVTQATRPATENRSPVTSALRREVEVLAGEILAQPDIGGARVPLHPLQPGDARGGLGHRARSLAGRALPGHDLHVLVHAEAAGIAGRAAGGQHVVGARRLVAKGDGRLLAQEQRAIAGEPPQPPVETLGLHRQVLGGIAVGGRRHLLAVA